MDTRELLTIPIDIDVVTGKVTIDGATVTQVIQKNLASPEGSPESTAVIAVKEGDRFPVSIGWFRNGVAQMATMEELNIGVKEFEPDALVTLDEGEFVQIRTGSSYRYYTNIYIDPDLTGPILSNYEEDEGTFLDLLCEIEGVFTYQAISSQESIQQSLTVNANTNDTVTTEIVLNQDVSTTETYNVEVGFNQIYTPDQTQLGSLAFEVDVTRAAGGAYSAAAPVGTSSITGGSWHETSLGLYNNSLTWDYDLGVSFVDGSELSIASEVTGNAFSLWKADVVLPTGWRHRWNNNELYASSDADFIVELKNGGSSIGTFTVNDGVTGTTYNVTQDEWRQGIEDMLLVFSPGNLSAPFFASNNESENLTLWFNTAPSFDTFVIDGVSYTIAEDTSGPSIPATIDIQMTNPAVDDVSSGGAPDQMRKSSQNFTLRLSRDLQ